MKKSRISLFVAVLTVLCCAAPAAFASQGLYGYVYAYTGEDFPGHTKVTADSRNVANASIYVYDSNSAYVTQTTASICGYYTLTLSPGTYYLVVMQQGYYLRYVSSCSSANEYSVLTASRSRTVSSGAWIYMDLLT